MHSHPYEESACGHLSSVACLKLLWCGRWSKARPGLRHVTWPVAWLNIHDPWSNWSRAYAWSIAGRVGPIMVDGACMAYRPLQGVWPTAGNTRAPEQECSEPQRDTRRAPMHGAGTSSVRIVRKPHLAQLGSPPKSEKGRHAGMRRIV